MLTNSRWNTLFGVRHFYTVIGINNIKTARWLAFLVMWWDTHRDVVVGEPPYSRQALACDQSGPPKSPAIVTLTIIFVFHTPDSYCLSTFPSILLNKFVQQDILLSPMHALLSYCGQWQLSFSPNTKEHRNNKLFPPLGKNCGITISIFHKARFVWTI